jgi:hypothetical protein
VSDRITKSIDEFGGRSDHTDIRMLAQISDLHLEPKGFRNIIRIHACNEFRGAILQALIEDPRQIQIR